MILGVDISTYLEVLEHGVKFYDGDKEIDPLDAFYKNGVNWCRIRIWNDPKSEDGEPYLAGNCDIENYIMLGKLVKEKGYHILMDLHYSDFWADPGKQMIPKAWVGYNIDELTEAVYSFTKDCLEKAKENGVAPEMIQVGNEITKGILWPHGMLEDEDGNRGNYENFLKLIGAGVKACREVNPNAKIMLHLERSNDKAVYQEFFTKVQNAGIDYDIIGASYYPNWHGKPYEMIENLNACKKFGKKIMIAELGYGFSTEPYELNGKKHKVIIDKERAEATGLTDKYPLTPEGQARYIKDLLSLLSENKIDGGFYWEPLWLCGEGISWGSEKALAYINEQGKTTHNEWANQCLFDYNGRKLPAFDEYRL